VETLGTIFIGKRKSSKKHRLIIACIICGLEFLHNNGVIHRDLRPENVLFDTEGYVKLIDYGHARIHQAQNSSDTSGSPGYSAPEIVLRQNHSATADFFSLGVILHEIMLGKKPYKSTDRTTYKENLIEK